jgi:tRNA (guanine37-N1)-methyltransferase
VEGGGLLEYPQYTRPRNFHGLEAPEVLLGGNHARIEAWRFAQSYLLTRARRPDLLEGREWTRAQRRIIDNLDLDGETPAVEPAREGEESPDKERAAAD